MCSRQGEKSLSNIGEKQKMDFLFLFTNKKTSLTFYKTFCFFFLLKIIILNQNNNNNRLSDKHALNARIYKLFYFSQEKKTTDNQVKELNETKRKQ